jgi:hypothetical protein
LAPVSSPWLQVASTLGLSTIGPSGVVGIALPSVLGAALDDTSGDTGGLDVAGEPEDAAEAVTSAELDVADEFDATGALVAGDEPCALTVAKELLAPEGSVCAVPGP